MGRTWCGLCFNIIGPAKALARNNVSRYFTILKVSRRIKICNQYDKKDSYNKIKKISFQNYVSLVLMNFANLSLYRAAVFFFIIPS